MRSTRLLLATLAVAWLGLFQSRVAHAQRPGAAGAGQIAPVAPAPDVPAKRPAPAAVAVVHWWCEINALPTADAQMTPDEAADNYFMSQVIERRHRVGPDETKAVQRLCRTAFTVQFGGQWDLVTTRVQQAPSADAARLNREADMRAGNHLGHVRTFRIPG